MGSIPISQQKGTELRGWCPRLPTADSLCSLKVARASKISGRKFSAVARRKRTAFTSAEMAALKCNAAAVGRFLLAALHSVAKRVSRGQAYHPTRSVPRLPERPHGTPPPPRSAASFPRCRAIAVSPRRGKDRKTRGVLVLAEPWEPCALSQQRQMGTSRARQHAGGSCGGGGVGWARLSRVDPLCDRMERGEEEATTGRRIASQRSHFCRR